MKFNLVQIVKNKELYYLIHDPLRSLLYTLESLGHDVIVSKDSLMKDRINIIALGLRYSEQEIQAIVNSKVPYIVYQTEVFSSKGLNYFEGMPIQESLNVQERYVTLCRNALMVWECFDFNQQYLQSIGIESHIIYHGYHPRLEGLPKKKELDIDLCFFGSLTHYRKQVLQQLRKRKLSISVLQLEPPLFRDEVLRRSKINLSIRANDTTMSHLPHFRVLTGLYFDTMTISERGRGQDWMQNMMSMVDVERFVDEITATLASKEYIEKGLQYKENLKQHPMTELMEPLVSELQGRYV